MFSTICFRSAISAVSIRFAFRRDDDDEEKSERWRAPSVAALSPPCEQIPRRRVLTTRLQSVGLLPKGSGPQPILGQIHRLFNGRRGTARRSQPRESCAFTPRGTQHQLFRLRASEFDLLNAPGTEGSTLNRLLGIACLGREGGACGRFM